MQTTAIDVTAIPSIDHDEAMAITAVENRKFAEQLRSFEPERLGRSRRIARCGTCQAVAAHVVGFAAGQASPREFFRQKRGGRPLTAEIGAQYWWDGMNEIQVRERAALTTDELIAEWDTRTRERVAGPHEDCPA